jgi:hypothetical protein
MGSEPRWGLARDGVGSWVRSGPGGVRPGMGSEPRWGGVLGWGLTVGRWERGASGAQLRVRPRIGLNPGPTAQKAPPRPRDQRPREAVS